MNEFRFDLDGHLNIVKMSRTVECLGLLPLVERWTVDRLMVVYMNGVVSCGCVGASDSDLIQRGTGRRDRKSSCRGRGRVVCSALQVPLNKGESDQWMVGRSRRGMSGG